MKNLQFYLNIVVFSSENQNGIFSAAYLENSGPFLSFSLKKNKDFSAAYRKAEHKLEGRKKVMIKKAKYMGS